MVPKIIKKIIGAFGYKIVSKRILKNSRLINTNGYFNLKKILKNLFLKEQIKTLVQIGANDGILFDHLNEYIFNYKPRALLVEPIKDNFSKLKKNYALLNCVTFENSAISVGSEIISLYKVNPSKLNLYDKHVIGITSFSKKHLIEHGVKSFHIVKENVQTVTIEKLLIKHSIKNLDLLFIDAEGYDCKIVCDFLKNSLLRPIIVCEYIHSDNNFFSQMLKMLSDNNYIYFSINENLISFPYEKKHTLDFS